MEEQHFKNIFWFITSTTIIVLLYVISITFIPIPKENQRFVDIALAFLLGWLSGNSQYLTGGTPTTKKPDTIIGNSQNTTVNTKKDEASNISTTDIDNPL